MKRLLQPGIHYKFHLVVIAMAFFLPWGTMFAQNGNLDPDPREIAENIAPVKVDGDVLFMVRGTTSFPASQRAASISKRIKKAAANHALTPDSIRIVNENEHLQVFIGREFIMNIFSGDAEIEQLNLETYANQVKKKIGTTLEHFRFVRSKPVLIRKSLNAMAAMILLTVLLLFFIWLFRRMNRALQKRIQSKIESVEHKSFKLIQSGQIWKGFNILFKTLRISAGIVLTAVFINYILSLFPWTSGVATYVLKLFLDPIIDLARGLLRFLPNLAFLVVIFLASRYLLKLIRLLFTGLHHESIVIKGFYPEWAMPTFRLLRILVIVFAIVVAYPHIPGSGSSAFKGLSVFLGLLLSIGSSSFISNVIAGYSLTYRRAFKLGDRIKVNENDGFVEEQKLLVTRLRSIKNEEIVIPNSMMINSSILNYSAVAGPSGVVMHTVVGIGYETPWRQVDAMLRLAADRTEGLMKDPPPYVLKLSLGDFAVNYELNVYCHNVSQLHFYYNDLHQNILDVFNENHVQIMTPAYMSDPAVPKIVPEDKRYSQVSGDGGKSTGKG